MVGGSALVAWSVLVLLSSSLRPRETQNSIGPHLKRFLCNYSDDL